MFDAITSFTDALAGENGVAAMMWWLWVSSFAVMLLACFVIIVISTTRYEQAKRALKNVRKHGQESSE